MASLLPNGNYQFCNEVGTPLAGGKVYYYEVGTTTPKTTWQDYAQTAANTNPITLDAAGRGRAYGVGAYRQLVVDSNGVTSSDSVVGDNSLTVTSSIRNMIINGAMLIDQRNLGAAVTVSSSGQYITDRFKVFRGGSTASPIAQQNSNVPSGFAKSLSVTAGTGATPAAADYLGIAYVVEGQDCQSLAFGTVNAKTLTLSFWVKATIIGTFAVAFRNNAANRSYVGSYTINTVNTWEYKTITVVGDTSGTWATDVNAGLQIAWDLGVGSNFSTTAGSWQSGNFFGLTGGTKLTATTSASLLITGVQLEQNATASAFDNRPFATEITLAGRYCQRFDIPGEYSVFPGTFGSSTDTAIRAVRLSPPMRVTGNVTPGFIAADNAAYNGVQQTGNYITLTFKRAAASPNYASAGFSGFVDADY